MFNNSLSGYSGGSQNLSGVYTFSDGMGATIEDGTITANQMYVNNANITTDNQLTTKLYVDSVSGINLLPRNNIWSGTNAFNNTTSCNSTGLNNTPLIIQSSYTSPNNKISFCPYVSATGYNSITKLGDAIIFTDNATGLVIGTHTASYAGFRCDNTNTQQYGKTALSFYVWDSILGDKKVFEMLASTITSYLQSNFLTSIIDATPIQIKYKYLTTESQILFYPYTNTSTGNAYTQLGDTCIVGSSDFLIGKQDQYSAIRFTNNNCDIYGNYNITFTSNDISAANFDLNGQFNISTPINSTCSLTTVYENQFAGDIWTQKGLSSKNGLFIQNGITPGSTTYAVIDNTGNAILKSLALPSNGSNKFVVDSNGNLNSCNTISIPNTTTPKFVIDAGGNVNNCNSISIPDTITPKFKVNLTGDLQYCNTINIPDHITPKFKVDNVGIMRNCNGIFIPDSTTPYFKVTNIGDVDYCNSLSIPNNSTPLLRLYPSGNITAQNITCNTPSTSDNSTLVATTAFVKNQNYAQLSGLPQTFINSNTFTQSITGVTETTTDNSTKLATTEFVKNQGYSILNASNSFTGNQLLTNSGLGASLRIKSSTAVTTREGYHFIATSAGAFNSIVSANDYVIFGRDSSAMDIGALTLTTHSNTACGVRITNNSVSMTGTTIQTNGNLKINNSVEGPSTSYATTSNHIGYVNHITSFTAPSGNGVNVLGTYIFDNTATNYAYGTYLIITNIRVTPATAGIQVKLSWSTQTTVMTGLWLDSQTTLAPNVLKITVPLQAYSTQTWYLLFQVVSGTYTFNSAACSLDIVRIA